MILRRSLHHAQDIGRLIGERLPDELRVGCVDVEEYLLDLAVFQSESDDSPGEPGPVEIPDGKGVAVAFKSRGQFQASDVRARYGFLEERLPGKIINDSGHRQIVCLLKRSDCGECVGTVELIDSIGVESSREQSTLDVTDDAAMGSRS